MKILIYSDCHWSTYSSIVRSRGEKYSTRLHNLINSINWAESLVQEFSCDRVVCLGDFFDRDTLNSEEITALGDIEWSNVPHYMLVGNHEMGRNDLSFSSMHIFNQLGFNVISKPIHEVHENINLVYIPYLLEDNRKPFSSYCENVNSIVFSHNDLSGIQMGKFISKSGFNIDDIENGCKLFLNGHLHNESMVRDSVINVGNLTGQNFSEDAMCYKHYAIILDTDTFHIDYIENPHAFNFFKLTYDTLVSLDCDNFNSNCIISISITEDKIDEVKAILNSFNCHYKISIISKNNKNSEDVSSTHFDKVDHIKMFQTYVEDNITDMEFVLDELAEVCK